MEFEKFSGNTLRRDVVEDENSIFVVIKFGSWLLNKIWLFEETDPGDEPGVLKLRLPVVWRLILFEITPPDTFDSVVVYLVNGVDSVVDGSKFVTWFSVMVEDFCVVDLPNSAVVDAVVTLSKT